MPRVLTWGVRPWYAIHPRELLHTPRAWKGEVSLVSRRLSLTCSQRAVLFHTAGGIGALLSGVLQAAAYSNLTGKFGLAGWRWRKQGFNLRDVVDSCLFSVFIIDAIITLPIAVVGLLFLPALPGQSGNRPTFWLSQADLDLTDRRMAAVGRKPKAPITRTRLLGFLRSWHLPVLTLNYVFWNNSLNAQNIMPLWLKSFNSKQRVVYTVPEINHYPMPITVRAS
jgi:ACS family pantothenate transporter-like MFS transporter